MHSSSTEEMKEPLLRHFKHMGGSAKVPIERTIELFPETTNVDPPLYPENVIVSSRYNIFNFFPKSLLEQFRRLANVYFLVIGTIAAVGGLTSYYETAIEPEGILGPMAVVVLISVLKDGIEDIKRHNADSRINSKPAKIVKETGEVVDVIWRDLGVGDIVLIVGDEEIPADTLVLACGGVQGPTAYVETAAIDGETNLKLKQPCLHFPSNECADISVTADRTQVNGLRCDYRSHLTAEPPNSSIHRFNGVMEVRRRSGEPVPLVAPHSESGDLEQSKSSVALSEKNLLLRGSVLRATEWCIGQIVYTGADTKLSLNSKRTPSKLSSVDRIVNRTLMIAIGVMLFVCVLSMIFEMVWSDDNSNASYLCLQKNDLNDEYMSGGGCESAAPDSFLTIFTFATLYNNFVCISMYVSLEMVYLAQSYFLSNDLKLYDSVTDTPAECHSSGMCADLGQVQYVLSDKTGTLTKNQMVVKQFSISGSVYGAPISQSPTFAAVKSTTGQKTDITASPTLYTTSTTEANRDPTVKTPESSDNHTGPRASGLSMSATAHRAIASRASSQPCSGEEIKSPLVASSSFELGAHGINSTAGGSGSASSPAAAAAIAALQQEMFKPQQKHDSNPHYPLGDMKSIVSGSTDSAELERQLKLDFLRVLVYCNTAMLMPDERGVVNVTDAASLERCLQAESPDEVALIMAAAEHCGAILTTRNNTEVSSIGLQPFRANTHTLDKQAVETVQLLAVNAFDSDRKMMSVLVSIAAEDVGDVQQPENNASLARRYFLLCKGADSSMLTLCNRDTVDNPHFDLCMKHIDQFACTGLRTLVAGSREVCREEAERWLSEYKAASNSLSRRGELLFECAKVIENSEGLRLLGAIGIEDELQDDVAASIDLMHRAGLNVWMITGDKAETAIAIGKHCALVDPERQEVERVLNLSGEALRQRILDLHTFVVLRRGNRLDPGRNNSEISGPTSTSIASQRGGLANSSSSSISQSSSERLSSQFTERGFSGLSIDQSNQSTQENTISNEVPSFIINQPREITLVVDGMSLEGLWGSQDLKKRFVETVQMIPTVIACRVSPLQKAALVRMIKSAPGNPVTLAIGDGANDVGMIHEARVGVGISGKEGRHAANSADFAIAQFSFIVTLLFEHGRFNYIRCSKLVLYSFFKNLLLVSMLFFLCFYSGFSGTVPIDTIIFSGYNFYLGLPVLVLSAMDFDIPREEAVRFPFLAYATGRKGEMLNMQNMARWCIFAFIQGLLLFVVGVRFITGHNTMSGIGHVTMTGVGMNDIEHGWNLGMYPAGFILYTSAVVAMQCKIVAMSTTPNWIFWGVWWLSFAGYFLFTYLYGLFPQLDWFNTVQLAMRHPIFWMAIFFIPVMLCLSDYALDTVWDRFLPGSQQQLQEMLRQETKDRRPENAPRSSSGGAGSSTSDGVALVRASSMSKTTSWNDSEH